MSDEKTELLTPLFERLAARDTLSGPERDALLAAQGEVRTVAARQDIVAQGSRPTSSSLLVNGLAARYVGMRDGARRISGLHFCGDFVDLHSLVLKTMDHGIVAINDCTVVSFPHEGLREITRAHPHLTRLLWTLTLIDAAIHRQWLVIKGLDSLGEAAHLLCELFLRHQVVGMTEGNSFTLPMTQQDFGDALGKSLVQTNRVIQTLRRLGAITWQGQQVTILDWDHLVELGEFDPTYLNLDREPR